MAPPELTRSAPPARTRNRFTDCYASRFSTPTRLAKCGLQLFRYTGDAEPRTIRAATSATTAKAEAATPMGPGMTDATEATATTMPRVILDHVAVV